MLHDNKKCALKNTLLLCNYFICRMFHIRNEGTVIIAKPQ